MFSMSKSNPFASVQPFRDDPPAPPDAQQGLHNDTSSITREAAVAPAIVTTQSWGEEGETSSTISPAPLKLRSCTVLHVAVHD